MHQPNIINKNKERIIKKPVKGIKIFLKKKKNNKYGCKRYKNLSEGEKQKLVEYRKILYKPQKKKNVSQIKTSRLE